MAFNPKTDAVIDLLTAATTATPVGNHVARGSYIHHSIQVINNVGTCVVKIFASMDGTNWVQIGPDITADAYVILELGVYPFLRAERNAAVGNVTVTLASGGWLR